jgi:MFS transporter, AAHS family, 4-hydroxybenzoate transporter
VDGFDNQAIAYVAPALAQDWHLGRAALGPVFGIGAFGTLVGSLSMGPLGDRFGRRTLMLGALLLVALFSFLTTLATTLPQLMAVRFITGCGLGAMIPSTIVMANEYAPRRSRARMVTTMACGFAAGAALGGQVAAVLLPRFGWQAVFLLGTAAPLAMALAVWIGLPESLRYLQLRSGATHQARIRRILRHLAPDALDADARLAPSPPTESGSRVGALFRQGRAKMTVLLWGMFFLNLFVLNFINNWLPSMLHDAGLQLQQAVRVTTSFQLGGIAGVILMGMLADRFGYYRVIAGSFLVAAVFTVLIGLGTGDVVLVVLVVGVCGFAVIGGQMTASALIATLYPTAIRSTGTSWGLGIGRIGSFTGPLAGGWLIAAQMPMEGIFAVVAIPALCGAVVVALLARSTRGPHAGPAARSTEATI